MRPFRLGYRSPLDGLRGVAIVIVMVVHGVFPNIQARGNGGAFVGVDIFFALSGFLITCLLLEEWTEFNRISLRRFYARRALRLLPALGAMLGVLIAYGYLFAGRGSGPATVKDALLPLGYISNWTLALDQDRPVLFAHTWSLSIEEQFYLLWPVCLLLLLKRNSSRYSLLNYVVLITALAVVGRILLVAWGAKASRITHGTDSRADSLLLGAVLAVALSSSFLPDTRDWKRFVKALAWLSVAALVTLCFRRDFNQPFAQSVLFFLVSLFAAAIILEVVTAESGLLARILSRPWLVFIGKVSYGLYLWHYPIFFLILGRDWPYPVALFLALALTALATLASFYLLEKPLLEFKRKFQRVH